jgi:hypothetical protein
MAQAQFEKKKTLFIPNLGSTSKQVELKQNNVFMNNPVSIKLDSNIYKLEIGWCTFVSSISNYYM